MGILTVNDLKAGMILAQAAKNKNGTVILGEDGELTERHINAFRAWGVTEVDIKGIDSNQVVQDAMDALSSDVVASIERELETLFPPFEDNPVMEEIYTIVKKMQLRQAVNTTGGATDVSEKD